MGQRFLHIGANTWILIFGEYAEILVKKFGAGMLLMSYGILAVAMIGAYQCFARKGEKRGIPGCDDPRKDN